MVQSIKSLEMIFSARLSHAIQCDSCWLYIMLWVEVCYDNQTQS